MYCCYDYVLIITVGELQRRIGVKALEAGGNAIIGYWYTHTHTPTDGMYFCMCNSWHFYLELAAFTT